MKHAWVQIRYLTEKNARHLKKGWRLGEITPEQELKDAAGEMVELAGDPENVEEFADLLGCLFGYAIKKGWSISQVEDALLRKLSQRFEEPA